MTREEAATAQKAAIELVNAYEALRYARERLATVLKWTDKDKRWKVSLTIDKDLPYGHREEEFVIPRAYLEQQLIDKVKRVKRRVIELGGTP